jgi:hypothetical protein
LAPLLSSEKNEGSFSVSNVRFHLCAAQGWGERALAHERHIPYPYPKMGGEWLRQKNKNDSRVYTSANMMPEEQ